MPERSEASGLEFNLKGEISPGLSAWGTLSWARVADDMAGDDVVRSWDQSLAMTAGLAWQGSRFNASAFGSWHRGWPRTNLDFAQPPFGPGVAPIVLGKRNAGRWGDYYSLDLRASYLWPLRNADFSIVLEATNVTNRENDCCAILQTTADGGFGQDVENWLPAIVNLGFSYRWRSRD
jgi:outer membrane receptor protein involved in Fe transport